MSGYQIEIDKIIEVEIENRQNGLRKSVESLDKMVEEIRQKNRELRAENDKIQKFLESSINEARVQAKFDAVKDFTEGYTIGQTVYAVYKESIRENCPLCKGNKKLTATIKDNQQEAVVECPKCGGYGAVSHYKNFPIAIEITGFQLYGEKIKYGKDWRISGKSTRAVKNDNPGYEYDESAYMRDCYTTIEECQVKCDELNEESTQVRL